MASDEIVWQIINQQFCSFKLKPMQPPILPPRKLPLCHYPLKPRNRGPLPLHKNHRARTHAQQAMGTNKTLSELRQSARADRREIDLLAEVLDIQMQAETYAINAGGHTDEEVGEGGGEVGGEDCAETGAQGAEEGGYEGEEGGGCGEGGEGY
ncbi:MAG: hypothetical protein Q9164_006531 [Protoblastenia rupestris]